MTASDIITKCDNIKPNVYSYKQKLGWLKKIESDITEYVNNYREDKIHPKFHLSDNPTLYLDDCEENIYLYYLISMIDLSNQEYDLYNNSGLFFNHELNSWKKKYRRENKPKCDISIKI